MQASQYLVCFNLVSALGWCAHDSRLQLRCVQLQAMHCTRHTGRCHTYNHPGCRVLVLSNTVAFFIAGASSKDLYQVPPTSLHAYAPSRAVVVLP